MPMKKIIIAQVDVSATAETLPVESKSDPALRAVISISSVSEKSWPVGVKIDEVVKPPLKVPDELVVAIS
jgi:hypothetical protein